MTASLTLFPRPFDLHDIADVIARDWSRFSQIAFLALGRGDGWDRAADDLVELFERFSADGIDDAPLKLFDLLVAHCFGRAERVERLTRFADKLGFAGVSDRIGRVMVDAAKSPMELQQDRNMEWLRGYRQKLDAERALREAAARARRKP